MDDNILYLIIDEELIITTTDHPFLTEDEEWVEAGDLAIGEQVFQADGTPGEVQSSVAVTDWMLMYNLTVDQAHTFFVGDGEWLVHNTCDFRRFGNAVEAAQAQLKNILEFAVSGQGNRVEKWIADSNYIGEIASFGNPRNYTHRMDIFTSGEALGWLNRNAVDYDTFQDALSAGLNRVPRISDGREILVKNVLVITKTNEPGWYGLTHAGLGLFNRNINNINSVNIR